MPLRTLPFFAALLLAGSVFAQKKGKNSQQGSHADIYLPVECNVTANGGPTDLITVTVFKDNEQAFVLSPEKKKSSFLLDLDMDSYYTVRASKDGYREKTVYIDTHLPEGQLKYKSSAFALNLDAADKFAHGDQFYLDFPSAIIQWSEKEKTFAHNDEYLANIQLKMALLGAQMETR